MDNEHLQKELRELFERTIDPTDPDRLYIDILVDGSMEHIDEYTNYKVKEELWGLYDYMWRHPDDLNLEVMSERIEFIEREIDEQ